jgi:coenzyme F420-reducing hydrogenase delta subunit
MNQTKDLTDNKKVNYALDDRIINIKCTDGELEIPVYNAVKSQYIKNYIETYDENKENTPLSIKIYFTKEEFNTALKPHLCVIEDFLMLPKRVTLSDIFDMDEDKFNKFINSSVINVNKFAINKYRVIVKLNDITHKFTIQISKSISSGVYDYVIQTINGSYKKLSSIYDENVLDIDVVIKKLVIRLLSDTNDKLCSDMLKLFVDK